MYKKFADYYDSIFPENKETTAWLIETFKKRNTLLDIACGTGSYAMGLHQKGFSVEGRDLDATMILKAIEKKQNASIDFKVEDMVQLKDVNRFNGIYCIGNSLVHLNDFSSIASFVKKVFQALKEEGLFVVQIINYNRIYQENIHALPTIKNNGITFVRNYRYQPPHILFETHLQTEKDNHQSTVKLYPLMVDELKNALEKSGFKDIYMYDGFTNKSFNPTESYHCVVKAYKKQGGV